MYFPHVLRRGREGKKKENEGECFFGSRGMGDSRVSRCVSPKSGTMCTAALKLQEGPRNLNYKFWELIPRFGHGGMLQFGNSRVALFRELRCFWGLEVNVCSNEPGPGNWPPSFIELFVVSVVVLNIELHC